MSSDLDDPDHGDLLSLALIILTVTAFIIGWFFMQR